MNTALHACVEKEQSWSGGVSYIVLKVPKHHCCAIVRVSFHLTGVFVGGAQVDTVIVLAILMSPADMSMPVGIDSALVQSQFRTVSCFCWCL